MTKKLSIGNVCVAGTDGVHLNYIRVSIDNLFQDFHNECKKDTVSVPKLSRIIDSLLELQYDWADLDSTNSELASALFDKPQLEEIADDITYALTQDLPGLVQLFNQYKL